MKTRTGFISLFALLATFFALAFSVSPSGLSGPESASAYAGTKRECVRATRQMNFVLSQLREARNELKKAKSKSDRAYWTKQIRIRQRELPGNIKEVARWCQGV